MPIPTLISDLSPVIGSNYPTGSESPTTADDYLRAHAAFIAQVQASLVAVPTGACRLVKSGANIVLQRFNGTNLTINGLSQVIPSAGVTFAPTGLIAGTLYFIYAYMSGATMTLEASTTGHSTDTSSGVEIKTGDATRTLVGMVRPIAGPAFADTATQRFVLSWFNQRALVGTNAFTSSQLSGVLNVYFEINASIRVEFLCWANTLVDSRADGSVVSTAAGGSACTTVLSYDAAIGDASNFCSTFATGSDFPVAMSAASTLAEGYHYSTLFGNLSGSGWRWQGNASPGLRCSIRTITLG